MFFPPFLFVDGSLQGYHTDSRGCRLNTFVPVFTASPVDGLLQGIGCQHAENEGESVLEIQVHQSVRNGIADEIKVPGFSLDHTAQAKDRVVALPVGHPPGSQG